MIATINLSNLPILKMALVWNTLDSLTCCVHTLTEIKQKRDYARVQQELCNISPQLCIKEFKEDIISVRN